VRDINRPILVFPQDYHLYLVPQFLREALGEKAIIQPFLHIPWPSPDAWRILPEPMRTGLLSGILASDQIGFQTRKDAFNFVQTCRFYLADAHSYGHRDRITFRGREVRANSYPISIDVEKLEKLADEPATQQFRKQIARTLGENKLILRVDRVEPSKNILRGMAAFRTLLETYPEHRGNVQMLSLLVPSRMEVGEYRDYLRDIMAESGMINAQFSDGDWEPSRIVVGDNYPRAIAAMQLYDVLLVNPITDGMNLVAKEGALVNQQDGVLLLSEFAGAFYELGDQALVISPFDIYSTVEALHLALTMPPAERHQRAETLKNLVRSRDIRQWFKNQVDDAVLAFNTHASKSSTPDTPETVRSAESSTD
jgi:trehalose 6-phosphate synthase